MATLPSVKRRLVRLAVRCSEAGLDAIGVRPAAALLLLGHMRSGSTLLLHVLLTNPEISAMGERNASYETEDDLARLVIATRLARRTPLRPLRYVADQINHDRFTPNRRLLEHPRARLLFLLRQPESSISSLLDLTRTYYQPWPIARAVGYYVERLQTLADLARGLARREHAAFLTYEDLTERPADVLARLQAFLGTRGGFSERYGIHPFTGTRGDPTPNIGTGRIGRPRSLARAELPPEALEQARQAYARCREALAPLALPPPG